MMRKEALKSEFLLGKEEIGARAKRGQVSPVVFNLRSELAEQFHEVLLDDTYDMESIRDDLSVWKVSFDQRSV